MTMMMTIFSIIASCHHDVDDDDDDDDADDSGDDDDDIFRNLISLSPHFSGRPSPRIISAFAVD